MSRKQYEKFLESVRTNGITESIKVVEHNGRLFVVDGHHRISAAKSLDMKSVPIEKVQLPSKGYKTLNDSFD